MNIELLVILLIAVACFVLILTNFSASIYVLLMMSVLVHKELFSFFKWDLLPVRGFMLALTAAALLRAFLVIVVRRKFSAIKSFIGNPLYVLLSLLWLVRGFSIFFSRNVQESLFMLGFFTTIVFLGVCIFNHLSSSSEKTLKYIKFYTYIGFALSLFGYCQLFLYERYKIIIGALWNVPNNLARVGATFWDVNHYGALIIALLPVIGVLFLVEKQLKNKLGYLLMLIPMTGSLLLTNSRTAWMMAFFAFISFITIQLIKRVGFRGIGYVLAVLTLVAIPLLWQYSIKSSPFRAHVKQYFHYRLDSFDSHIMLLAGALEIYQKYPVLGGGYGSFFEHFSRTKIAPAYFARDPAALNTRVPPHTIWGELISETGTVGLGVFILLWGFLILTLLYASVTVTDRKQNMLCTAMAAVFIGWTIAGIFYSYNSEFFWLVFVLYLSYGVSVLGGLHYVDAMVAKFLRPNKAMVLAIGFLAAVLLFGGLGSTHLVPWDEAIYAKIAKNMVDSGDYLVQRWFPLRVWYEKPPLYMWLAAFSVSLFGNASFAYRLPSAIFGLATVLLTYLIGKRLFTKTAGFVAALALLTTTQFLYYARASMLDVTATFFITLSLYLYFLARSQTGKNLFILAGLAAGFAVMTKGVIGFLPYPILLVFEGYLLLREKKSLRNIPFATMGKMALFSSIVFLPWHLIMLAKFGVPFLQMYLGYHVWDRATSVIEDKGNPIWWYLIVLKVSMRVWFLGLLAALPHVGYKIVKKDTALTFLFIWALFILVFFSVARSKLIWYIIPIYPPLALLVGYFFAKALNYVLTKLSVLNTSLVRVLIIYLLVVFSVTYLVINKKLVYTSDLTGSEARLLQLKDATFGTDTVLFVDRIEQPLVLFYSGGPYEVVDFNPHKGPIPLVTYGRDLILLTKKGRFSTQVLGINKTPIVVKEDGDWVLWYFESDKKLDRERLEKMEESLSALRQELGTEAEEVLALEKQCRDLAAYIADRSAREP